jgi:hypothetical protein
VLVISSSYKMHPKVYWAIKMAIKISIPNPLMDWNTATSKILRHIDSVTELAVSSL